MQNQLECVHEAVRHVNLDLEIMDKTGREENLDGVKTVI